MAGTATGSVKTAAKKAGVKLEEYLSKRDAGLKFCWRCRVWRDRNDFGVDSTRGDGKFSICIGCRKQPKQMRLKLYTQDDLRRLRYATDPEYRTRTRQRGYARKRGTLQLLPEAVVMLTERFVGLCT